MKNKIKIISIILFISVFLVIISCQKQKVEWKGTIEEENGVTVVKNPKEPMYAEDVFNLEEELSIGEIEGREEYMFSQISHIVVDEEERIYVSDSFENHIKVFNKHGEYIRTIGRKGKGPGELERPRWLSITQQNELMVENYGNRLLSFFSLDGKHIKSLSTTKIFIQMPKINSRGDIIIESFKFIPPNIIYELNLYDPAMSFLRTLVSFSIPLPSPEERNPISPVFRWQITKDDNIIYGYPETYELKIINSDGKLLKRILKKYDPVEVTQEEKEEYIKEYKKAYKGEIKLNFSPYHPAYRWFILDEEGRIYVQTNERFEDGKGYYHDIFDSEGRYITTIPLSFVPLIWKKNKLYTVEADKGGYQMVKRYKFTWKY